MLPEIETENFDLVCCIMNLSLFKKDYENHIYVYWIFFVFDYGEFVMEIKTLDFQNLLIYFNFILGKSPAAG